jgi:RTX calcium-binding nonapeptide repeat (4 copies)
MKVVTSMKRMMVLLAAMAFTLVVASGVAWAVTKIGTNGPDTLVGTNGNDNLIGKGGNDVLFSLAGRDNLLGGPDKDIVLGENTRFIASRGDKNLRGDLGNDIVVGGRGSDNVLGDAANDFLVDGPDREFSLDRVSGGDGNDVFFVANAPAAKDIVTCGDGFDRVLADRKDLVVPDCERVFIGFGSEDEFFASIPQSFCRGLLVDICSLLTGG